MYFCHPHFLKIISTSQFEMNTSKNLPQTFIYCHNRTVVTQTDSMGFFSKPIIIRAQLRLPQRYKQIQILFLAVTCLFIFLLMMFAFDCRISTFQKFPSEPLAGDNYFPSWDKKPNMSSLWTVTHSLLQWKQTFVVSWCYLLSVG